MRHTEIAKAKISKHHARHWLGKRRPPLSKEHKDKLIGSLLGNQFTRGMKFPNRKKAPPKSEETKMKYRLNLGSKASHWKGGCLAYRKNEVLIRDNYTCQVCGLRDPDVAEVDHKIPKKIRPDLANNLENLWVLCANDHRRKTKKDIELIRKFRLQN